jgi:ribonuclease HII
MKKSAVQLNVMPTDQLKEARRAASKARQRSGRAHGKKSSVLRSLLKFDLDIHNVYKCKTLIGVDEVGRGCLAGPVVAAAVILPPEFDRKLIKKLALLNDSKQIKPADREEIAAVVKSEARWGIGSCSPEEIDTINIYHASLLAMRRALDHLYDAFQVKCDAPLVVLDGKAKIADLVLKQIPIVKGDEQSACIAAASVVAKVHRDRLMTELSKDVPHYKWESNKGYACRAHVEGIRVNGITIWHRRTFLVRFGDLVLVES